MFLMVYVCSHNSSVLQLFCVFMFTCVIGEFSVLTFASVFRLFFVVRFACVLGDLSVLRLTSVSRL